MSRAGEKRSRGAAKALLDRLGMTSNVKGYERCLEEATSILLDRFRRRRQAWKTRKYIRESVDISGDFSELAERIYAREHALTNVAAPKPPFADELLPLVDRIRVVLRRHATAAAVGRRNLKWDDHAIRMYNDELIRNGIKSATKRNKLIDQKFARKGCKIPRSTLRGFIKPQSKEQSDEM